MGPQGTLFGRNTTGGAVNYYTKAPTDYFEAGLISSYSNFDRVRAEGFSSGPITADLLGRFSFFTHLSSGGPYDNQFNDQEIGSMDKFGVRGQLAWTGERTRIRALIHTAYDKSELTPFKNPGTQILGQPGVAYPEYLNGQVLEKNSACSRFGGLATNPADEFETEDVFTVNQDYYPTAKNEALGGFLRIEQDLPRATLISISAVEYFVRDEREDSDGTSTATVNIDWYSQIYQFSQEFRLTGEFDDRWRYVFGAFYEHDDIEIKESWNFSGHPYAFITTILDFPVGTTRSAANFEQTLDSFAGFFHNEFDLTDSLTITGGLRYTADITEITGQTFFGNGSSGDENTVTPVVIVDSRDGKERFDDNISFKLGAEWQPVNDWLIYGSPFHRLSQWRFQCAVWRSHLKL